MKYFSYLKIPAWKLCSSFDTRNDRWLQNTDQCILSFFSNLSTMAQTRSAAVSFVCKFTRFVVEMRGQRVSQTCSNKLSPLVLISLCVYVCLCKSVFTLFTSKNVTWFALFHFCSACVYSVFCFGCFLTLSAEACAVYTGLQVTACPLIPQICFRSGAVQTRPSSGQ